MPRPPLRSCTVLFGLLALAPAGLAQQASDDATGQDERIEALETQIAELLEAYKRLQAQIAALTGVPADAGDEYYIPRRATEFMDQGEPMQFGDEYTKPFLTKLGQNTYLGGYIDLEYLDSGGSDDRFFDQHRLIPLIYSDISDNVKFAAEVEIEHGSELEVEFAQLDFLFNDNVNLRAGIQLLPLGKLNEVHDSPIQDLTFRPLVNRYIIPTTLRDAGLGVWGDICENVSYQATITNGFKGLDAAGMNVITDTKGLRDAAPQSDAIGDPFDNINDDLAVTGRVAWRPELGVEIGASAHKDTYDENNDNDLRILALDTTIDGKAVPFLPDNVELLAEGAWASVDRDAFAKASGTVGNMNGYYVQTNVHFEPDFLGGWRDGGIADEDAHFTFVTRYDHVDLDTSDMRRLTLGLNFRPNASETVIKLDRIYNSDSGATAGTNDDNAWALSFASYF